jgi:hypothetical protein
MSVLRHTWQGRRIIRQFVIVMLLLAGQITLASCRHPGAQARGLALHVPHKLIHSNKIDWFIAEQYSSQCNILEALEPT